MRPQPLPEHPPTKPKEAHDMEQTKASSLIDMANGAIKERLTTRWAA